MVFFIVMKTLNYYWYCKILINFFMLNMTSPKTIDIQKIKSKAYWIHLHIPPPPPIEKKNPKKINILIIQ
jgi:hypothetical protein